MLDEIIILYRKFVVVHRIYDYVIINGFSIPCSNDANVNKKFKQSSLSSLQLFNENEICQIL